MTKALFLLLFAIAFSCPAQDVVQARCDDPKDTMVLYGPPMDLEKLEGEGRAFAAVNPAAPQVPFAYANKEWLKIVNQYRPGDTIRAFQISMLEGALIAAGYALSRDGCVVTAMGLSTSHF